MSNASVLAVNRRVTKQFIDTDPTVISLIPTVRTKTDGGSRVEEDGPPKNPQTFKLISIQFTAQQNVPALTIDGVERVITHYLLGEWDCDMEAGDHWVDDRGWRFVVVAMMDGHGWEKKGAVEAHGR